MTKFRANPWAVLLVVSLGFFMTLLDKIFPGVKNISRRSPQLITHEIPKEK